MTSTPTTVAHPANGSRRPTVHREVETKFDVPDGFEIPPLGGVAPVARVEDPEQFDLDATYFDTHDLRLIRAKVTLRRRTGGEDSGWHLKRPAVDGHREENRLPLGRAVRTVPQALQDGVAAIVRGQDLQPVVRLQTRRLLHRLRDAEGRLLAEVADDHVIASVGDEVSTWREVEVELVHGDEELLAAVGETLLAQGAQNASSASKLGRALRHRLPEPPPVLPAGLGRRSAGAIVLAYLRDQVDHLKEHDPKVRVDEEDAVHQMRVASRRLRSALATFRPLFDRTVTDPVRDQLKWLGEELGAARDAEVVRDHLRQLVAAEPSELVLGPVERRIIVSLSARHRAAHAEALEQLSSQRYFALLDSLDRLVAEPPLTELAAAPARQELPRLVRRTWRRIRRLVGEADAAETQEARDLALHEIRKAAKRARYAGESVTDFFGSDAKTFAKRMSAIQTVLGDHQDSVVVRDVLRELAVEAYGAGENAFTFGRLHALEQARGGYTEEDFAEAWAAASARKHLRWLG